MLWTPVLKEYSNQVTGFKLRLKLGLKTRF